MCCGGLLDVGGQSAALAGGPATALAHTVAPGWAPQQARGLARACRTDGACHSSTDRQWNSALRTFATTPPQGEDGEQVPQQSAGDTAGAGLDRDVEAGAHSDEEVGLGPFESVEEESAYVRSVAQILQEATGTAVDMDALQEVLRTQPPADVKRLVHDVLDSDDLDDVRAEIENASADVLAREDVRAALQRMRGGEPVSDGQLGSFVREFGVDVASENGPASKAVTRSSMQLLSEAVAAGEADIDDLLSLDASTLEGAAEMLQNMFGGLSKRAKTEFAQVVHQDENILFFLLRNLHHLQKDPETTLEQLYRVYQLQSRPVERSFRRGTGGALPPQVAWSAMKPLNTETSFRVNTGIVLFPPQRITLGAYVDLSKVVRPLRAKNLQKRIKHRLFTDIFHKE